MNTDEDHKNLLGITPVVEDWHTTCFLQVVIELIISIDSYFFVYTPTLQPVSMVLSTKWETFLGGPMWKKIQSCCRKKYEIPVTEYGSQISTGMFYLEFNDEIKHGDGERVTKYLTPIFLTREEQIIARKHIVLASSEIFAYSSSV